MLVNRLWCSTAVRYAWRNCWSLCDSKKGNQNDGAKDTDAQSSRFRQLKRPSLQDLLRLANDQERLQRYTSYVEILHVSDDRYIDKTDESLFIPDWLDLRFPRLRKLVIDSKEDPIASCDLERLLSLGQHELRHLTIIARGLDTENFNVLKDHCDKLKTLELNPFSGMGWLDETVPDDASFAKILELSPCLENVFIKGNHMFWSANKLTALACHQALSNLDMGRISVVSYDTVATTIEESFPRLKKICMTAYAIYQLEHLAPLTRNIVKLKIIFHMPSRRLLEALRQLPCLEEVEVESSGSLHESALPKCDISELAEVCSKLSLVKTTTHLMSRCLADISDRIFGEAYQVAPIDLKPIFRDTCRADLIEETLLQRGTIYRRSRSLSARLFLGLHQLARENLPRQKPGWRDFEVALLNNVDGWQCLHSDAAANLGKAIRPYLRLCQSIGSPSEAYPCEFCDTVDRWLESVPIN